MDNIENKEVEKIENIDTNKEVLDSLKSATETLKERDAKILELEQKNSELNRKTVEREVVKNSVNTSREDLQHNFKDFLLSVNKTGVSVPLPAQYVPEIVPGTGAWGVLQNCNRVGTLDSNVMYIARHETDATPYWMGLTGGGNSTTLSATVVSVNSNQLVTKIPIFDYQMNMGMFNALDYAKREVSRIMPKYEDVQVFAGTGAVFTGIQNDANALSVNQTASGAITNITLADMRNCVAKINPMYRNNDLKWYVDMSEEQTLLGVCDANNRVTDVQTGVSRMLGYEVVPVSSGVLNGITVSTTASKHFVLANLKEAVDYADSGSFNVEGIRTNHGATDYYFYRDLAIGVRQPNAAVTFALKA